MCYAIHCSEENNDGKEKCHCIEKKKMAKLHEQENEAVRQVMNLNQTTVKKMMIWRVLNLPVYKRYKTTKNCTIESQYSTKLQTMD